MTVKNVTWYLFSYGNYLKNISILYNKVYFYLVSFHLEINSLFIIDYKIIISKNFIDTDSSSRRRK